MRSLAYLYICFPNYLHLEESMTNFTGESKFLGLKRFSDEQDDDLYGINKLQDFLIINLVSN
ncbi:hypothetical protein IMY05_003G0036400 [Salix suchowensis]|nr:hypothetical protein IMY05_003G0036400 [Salix suchowensis]